eukprot:357492-Chlamydomonas_euryale.AAC.3
MTHQDGFCPGRVPVTGLHSTGCIWRSSSTTSAVIHTRCPPTPRLLQCPVSQYAPSPANAPSPEMPCPQCCVCNAPSVMQRLRCRVRNAAFAMPRPQCHVRNAVSAMPCPPCRVRNVLSNMPRLQCPVQHAMSAMPCPTCCVCNAPSNMPHCSTALFGSLLGVPSTVFHVWSQTLLLVSHAGQARQQSLATRTRVIRVYMLMRGLQGLCVLMAGCGWIAAPSALLSSIRPWGLLLSINIEEVRQEKVSGGFRVEASGLWFQGLGLLGWGFGGEASGLGVRGSAFGDGASGLGGLGLGFRGKDLEVGV